MLAGAQLFAKLIWQMSPCFEIPRGLLGLICLVDIVGNFWTCSWPVWRSCRGALQAVMLSLAAPSAFCAQFCVTISGSFVRFLCRVPSYPHTGSGWHLLFLKQDKKNKAQLPILKNQLPHETCEPHTLLLSGKSGFPAWRTWRPCVQDKGWLPPEGRLATIATHPVLLLFGIHGN